MKTLFLCTVLLVLLAFAFKAPEQSAWDFAREAGSSVVQKMTAGEKRDDKSEFARNLERKVEKNLDDLRRRLKKKQNNLKPTERLRQEFSREIRPSQKPAPEPRRRVNPDKVPDPVKKPTVPKRVAGKFREKLPEISIKPGPGLPPRPVEKVAAEPLPEAAPQVPETRAAVPVISSHMGSAELAEIGARFDRASRLLSEIK